MSPFKIKQQKAGFNDDMEFNKENLLERADAVIVGIGSEFAVNIEQEIKNSVLLEKIPDFEHFGEIAKKYIEYSIYYNEIFVKIRDGHKEGLSDNILRIISAYEKLKESLDDKRFFVVTTVTDGMVFLCGIDEDKIVAPCGDIRKLQTDCQCENDENPTGIFEAETTLLRIYEMMENSKDIVSENMVSDIIMKCEKCKQPYIFNIYGSNKYNENGYMTGWEAYTRWLQRTLNKRLVLLELGVDFKTPTVIRWPFEKVAMLNMKAVLYRVNGKLSQLPEEIKDKGVSINENAVDFINNHF